MHKTLGAFCAFLCHILAHLLCCVSTWHTKYRVLPLFLSRPRIFSSFRELKLSPNVCVLHVIQSSNLNVPCVTSTAILSEELRKQCFREAWQSSLVFSSKWSYMSVAGVFPAAFGDIISKMTVCACRQKSTSKQIENTSLEM